MMKRTILLLTLLLITYSFFGQSKDVVIYWNPPNKTNVIKETDAIKRDRLLSSINLELDGNTILFQKKWLDKGFANSTSQI